MTTDRRYFSSNKVNWLTRVPFTHRGLHNVDSGIFENTLAAAKASIAHGFPIEVDLQISGDRTPMAFHDPDLKRLTGREANIRETNTAELITLAIGKTNEKIPTFAEFLEVVGGQVGLLIELKSVENQNEGFAAAVIDDLKHYKGDFALMSFEHELIEDIRNIAPDIPLGLTAIGENDTYDEHKHITDKLNLDFVSYYFRHLENQFVDEFRQTGRPIISWTVTTENDAEYALKYSDQITFEGFLP